MGEESDGDANLLEEDSDPQPEPSQEADEPADDADSEPDRSEAASPDADGSDPDAVVESPDSPPEETDGDGAPSSPSEPPAADPESDGEAGGEEADGEAGTEEADDGPTDDADDGTGNLQPADRPDVSLDPDQLDPDREPTPDDPEGPDRPSEPPQRPEPGEPPERGERPEPPERPEEAERPGPPEGAEPPEEVEPPEDESAPLAEDVARPDSLEEAAGRSEPLEDEEMPLADHIEEMLKRLAVVLVVAGVVSLAVLPFSETLINFLWNSILPAGETTRPRLYGPLALVLTKLKVASLAGLVIALPVFVYETYLFMRPGLYPHERRYYLAAVPTSLVLAFVGISFAYFLILPVIFEYFLYYSEDVTTIAFALTKTFNLILLLMGYLAIVFQIPLFIMLAIMMGLTTRRWLVDRRLYFWGAFLGIAFLFSPDPTGMAPIMVATTMVALFEGTLFLLKWTGR